MTADSAAATPEEIAAPSEIATPEETPRSSAPSASAAFPITFSPLFWLVLLLAMGLLVPFVPVPNRGAAIFGAVLLTVIYVVAVVLLAAHLTRLRLPLRDTLGWLALVVTLWGVLQFWVSPIVGELFGALAAEGARPSGAQTLLLVATIALGDVGLLCMAVLGGSLVARLITAPNMLAPVCGFMALLDIWLVLFSRFVPQLMEQAPQYAEKMTASTPAVGAATASRFAIDPVRIGAADYLFLGLLFAALHAHKMNWRGAAWLTTLLISGALMGILRGIPALPGFAAIGLGIALPNLKFFKFTREEKFALLYAALFIVALTIGLFFATPFILAQAKRVG